MKNIFYYLIIVLSLFLVRSSFAENLSKSHIVDICTTLSPESQPDAWIKNGCGDKNPAVGVLPPPNITVNTYNTSNRKVPTNAFSTSKVKTSCSEFNMTRPDLSNLSNIMVFLRCFIGSLFPLVMLLGVVFFLWNIARYVIKPNPLKDDERRKIILAGLIGLFVMVGLWGITYFVSGTLGLGYVVPQIPVSK